MLLRSVILVLALGASACLFSAQHPAQSIIESKQSGSDSDRLKKLFEAHWKYSMEESPESATYNGYPGQNDRWSDVSSEAIQRRKDDLQLWQKALESIDRSKLPAAEQLNYDLFRKDLMLDIESSKFPGELMPVNQMGGVQQDIAQVIAMMPLRTEKDVRDVLARIRSAPKLIDQNIALMRRGAEQQITPPRITLRDVPQQIENQIVDDLQKNPVYRPFTNLPALLSASVRADLTNAAEKAIREELLPAWRKLKDFVAREYLPRTRESIAATDLPNGKAWYDLRVRRYTTTDLTPGEIHQIGLNEVTRIRAEMKRVMKEAKFNGSFKEFCEFLRSDPRFFYTNASDLLMGYRDISKRVDPELAKLFGKLPRLPYGVLPIPSYAEKSQTTAYYQPGAPAVGRAGYFCANTYDLTMRPKWEMEALTLHEAVPGHHLQIALSQEMENVPDFRRFGGYTAFVEGWGLYSESLGDEIGFYKDPYSKFGQLTYEMWRAIRLVVDTGMHALGWSRQQAIDFFKENAAKTEHDIVVEIDRYITWPGQALAYKIGELKIKELRRRTEQAFGAKFNVRDFHDQVLAEGAIPLDLLEKRITRWTGEKQLGVFDSHADVGSPAREGSAQYNADTQEYLLAAAGANMWAKRDEFHFAWKRLKGDFILQARVEFIGKGVDAHRKLGWMVRETLDPDSTYADAAVHGDGLTSLQFRRTAGGLTEEMKSSVKAPDFIQLERRGNTLLFASARFGEDLAICQTNLTLADEIYAGLFLCSHNSNVVEQARFRDVRIIRPAKSGFVPYRDYIGSNLELLDVQTGHRQSIFSSQQPFEAPNWTPDGKALIYNTSGRDPAHRGRLVRFDLGTRERKVIDTGSANRLNNDHVLSFDGATIGISHNGTNAGGGSTIFTVPIGGGVPKQITRLTPSYLHGWSPDGNYLVYTAARDKEFDIYKIPAAGGDEVRLTTATGLDDGPEYTPDGKYIYFNSNRSGLMQIWRMKPDGSHQEQITRDEQNNWFPHISPDGKWIAFISFSRDVDSGDHPYYKPVTIRLMPIEGGSSKVIAYVYGGQGTLNVPSWSPDGRQLAFVSNSAE